MDLACRPRTERRATPALLALLVAFSCVLALAPSAFAVVAGTETITTDDPNPVTGSPVTFHASTASDCGPTSFTFTVDNVEQPAQTSPDITRTFTTTGSHTVSVVAQLAGPGGYCGTASGTLTITVGQGVGGTISVSPDPPAPGALATLSVAPSGGLGAPYTGYRWTIDGVADPAGDDKRSYKRAFTAGSHVVKVTFSDTPDPASGNPAHSGSATGTITAKTPAPLPAGTPAPPAPPPCQSEFQFALSQFKTDGCFTKVGSNPDRWQTTDRVKLNGIAFADSGHLFTITGPTAAEPGGHIKTDNSAIEIDRFVPFSGNVDWTLPGDNGGKTTEGTLREVAVPSFTRLFNLRVAGSIAIKLELTNHKYSATFPMNVELPPAFTAGPSKFSGGVSGAASVRVDDAGVHYDGLRVSVEDVWVGQLRIKSACFSYVPAGGTAVAACDEPKTNGTSIACATNTNTDRFDGNAVIELPTASKTTLAAFGGLADGQVSKLGGYVDKLGTAVPIVPGVFLDRVGIGLCLSPPPFKLRGEVGVNALGGQLAVDGSVTYTDAIDSSPWSVVVDGSVVFKDLELGTAHVGFNAWGDVDFGVNSAIDIRDGLFTLDGGINGWIEPRNSTFTIQGGLRVCVRGLKCGQAAALVSNVGIAGCFDLGTYTIDLPDEVRQGPFGFGSITIITRKQTLHLQAGAGYRYGGSVSVLGSSCDMSSYASARSARAAGSGLSERIRPGTKAVTLRIHGTNGPPKVVVHGPGGRTITSPATGTGAQRKGRYLLAENPSDGTTNVLLVKPAAGRWTVTAAPGAASKPRKLDRSSFEAPPVLFGQTRKADGRREVAVEYAVPAGSSVKLVERGKGIGRTIVPRVAGKRCRGVRPLPDGRTMRCVRLKFRPSRGPGGTRKIEAVVTRGGMPVATKTVATFKVAREAKPSRPKVLRARRVGTSVVVAFPASHGASRLTATAVISDGRSLGFDLAASCRAVRIPDVNGDDAVLFKVAGVRYDLAMGTYARVTLKANRKSAGPKGKLPKRVCS